MFSDQKGITESICFIPTTELSRPCFGLKMYCFRNLSRGASLVTQKTALEKCNLSLSKCAKRFQTNTLNANVVSDYVEAQDKKLRRRNFRFMFPEFLPDPYILHRNLIRERLERADMLKRREVIEIPEFYVGSIVAVELADPNAVAGGITRFVGIVIDRGGTGLRAWIIVRNVIEGQGVEIRYDIYSPNVVNIETLKLEQRLDDELYYLRDAMPEYSTFPVDMEPELLPEGEPVPLNTLVVPLRTAPWHRHWERFSTIGLLKGYSFDADTQLNDRQKQKLEVFSATMNKGWQMEVISKYDLMRQYRNTIPIQTQDQIWEEVGDSLEKRDREIKRNATKRQIAKSSKK